MHGIKKFNLDFNILKLTYPSKSKSGSIKMKHRNVALKKRQDVNVLRYLFKLITFTVKLG